MAKAIYEPEDMERTATGTVDGVNVSAKKRYDGEDSWTFCIEGNKIEKIDSRSESEADSLFMKYLRRYELREQ